MTMDRDERAADSTSAESLALTVRRTIAASAARLYEAWTNPEQLLRWWGPRGVRCFEAQIDLRVGGQYRIGNEMPDGRVVWITGSFEAIAPGRSLTYSWVVDG